MTNKQKSGASLLIIGVILLSGWGEYRLLQAPLPNPFGVGGLGLLMGGLLAGLIGWWWPKNHG